MSFRSIVSLLCGAALALAATTGVFAQGASEYGSTTTGPAASTDQGGAGPVKKKSKAKTAKTKTGAASAKKQGQ